VENGGTLLVSYFSGIVDGTDTVYPGGYPGALRELLGLTVEEFLPLRAGERVQLSDGGQGDVWAEDLRPRGAEVVTSYLDGPAAGGPAVTRHPVGGGHAWYVSTRLSGPSLDPVLSLAYADAGLSGQHSRPEGVELVRRVRDDETYLVVINHRAEDVELAVDGVELITGMTCAGTLLVPGGEVRAVRTRER
jgi:beta-galactosidase